MLANAELAPRAESVTPSMLRRRPDVSNVGSASSIAFSSAFNLSRSARASLEALDPDGDLLVVHRVDMRQRT